MHSQDKGFIKFLRIFLGRVSPFIVLLGVIANIFSLLPKFQTFIIILLLISASCVVAYTIWYMVESRRTLDMRSKVDILEQEVGKGIRMTKNAVTVVMDIQSQEYRLEFSKEYQIISENPKYYSGQFYANKKLSSAEDAQEFYNENKVLWGDLNVCARLQYKNPEDVDWSSEQEVYVKHVADGNNYKEFHVEYETLSEPKSKLDIKKNTSIKLSYAYNVSVNLWGTYLNRYLTYWDEDSTVTIACSDKNKVRDANLALYRTNEIGNPVKEDGAKWSDVIRLPNSNCHCKTITIPKKKICCKYIVWWDAKKFFGNNVENTVITADDSHLTER